MLETVWWTVLTVQAIGSIIYACCKWTNESWGGFSMPFIWIFLSHPLLFIWLQNSECLKIPSRLYYCLCKTCLPLPKGLAKCTEVQGGICMASLPWLKLLLERLLQSIAEKSLLDECTLQCTQYIVRWTIWLVSFYYLKFKTIIKSKAIISTLASVS